MIPVSFESLINFSNIRKGPSLSKRVLEYNKKQQHKLRQSEHKQIRASQQHTRNQSNRNTKQTKLTENWRIIDEMECYKTTIDVDAIGSLSQLISKIRMAKN